MIKQVKKIEVLSFIILSIIAMILCIVLGLYILGMFGYKSNTGSDISGNKIKRIEMGMTLEQVISILGKPFEIDVSGETHSFDCKSPKFYLEMPVNENTDIIYIVDRIYNDTSYCCDAYKEEIQRGKRITLIYSNRPCFIKSLFIIYPMLWVHLDCNYCVQSVYVKQYDFPDKIPIYSLSWQTDEITLEEKSGEISLFINDELFNKCFKK